jgi:hypothetical protein
LALQCLLLPQKRAQLAADVGIIGVIFLRAKIQKEISGLKPTGERYFRRTALLFRERRWCHGRASPRWPEEEQLGRMLAA